MAAYSALTALALTILPPGRASVLAFSTPIWVVPLAAWRLQERAPRAALFGVGSDSMYGLGPFKQLHGQSIESLASYFVPAGTSRVTLDHAYVYENVRLSTGFVPARVAGDFGADSIDQGTALAIAVNGRVEATTRSYRIDGRARFATLVPEGAFHDGRNSVRVYALMRTAGHLRIQSLGGTQDAATAVPSNVALPNAIPPPSSAAGGG